MATAITHALSWLQAVPDKPSTSLSDHESDHQFHYDAVERISQDELHSGSASNRLPDNVIEL